MDDFSFLIVLVHFVFLLIAFHYVFFLYSADVMFIIIVFDRGLTGSPPVSSLDFYRSLPRGSVTGCDSLAGEFLLFSSALPSAYASSFPLLLLPLFSNRCADALMVYKNSFLNRLTAVLKRLSNLIIIIIIIIIKKSFI